MEDVNIDLIATRMHYTVKKCQDILAKWIVPDSGISDKDCLTELLGVLDDQSLVRFMKSIYEKYNKPL